MHVQKSTSASSASSWAALAEVGEAFERCNRCNGEMSVLALQFQQHGKRARGKQEPVPLLGVEQEMCESRLCQNYFCEKSQLSMTAIC